MADWSDVGASYSDAIVRFFPLQRISIFFVGFFASLSGEKSSESILAAISKVKLAELTSWSDGVLGDATGLNFLCGLIAVASAVFTSQVLTRWVFNLVSHATKLTNRVKSLDKSWAENLSLDDRKTALEMIEKATEAPRNRLRTMASLNELLLGLFLIFFAACFWTSKIDGLIAGIFLFFSIISHATAMHIFINDYYGLAATRAQLLGKTLPDLKIP